MDKKTTELQITGLETAFRNILDTFTGADGGEKFCAFQNLVREMDSRASTGDATALKVLEPVFTLSRFINVAYRLTNKG